MWLELEGGWRRDGTPPPSSSLVSGETLLLAGARPGLGPEGGAGARREDEVYEEACGVEAFPAARLEEECVVATVLREEAA